jgi:signal transduction histidine kinase
VGQAEQAVRQITQQLSPSILQMLGFVSALEWLAENMERQYGLTVLIYGKNCSRPLVEEIQAMLFRSVRELLINVAKHAKVGAATLSVFCDSEQLRLVVSDAGCGFTVARVDGGLPGNDRFGLDSIHERMSAIGGQMKIDSRPGHGATITLTLPCAIAAKASAP